jgi:hypothetical protein
VLPVARRPCIIARRAAYLTTRRRVLSCDWPRRANCLDADCALLLRCPSLPSAALAAPALRFAALAPPGRWNFGNSQRATHSRPHHACPLRQPPNAPSATPARRDSLPHPPRAPPIGALLSSIATRAPLTRAPGHFAPPGNVLCACASRPDHVKWWHWERHHGPIRHH